MPVEWVSCTNAVDEYIVAEHSPGLDHRLYLSMPYPDGSPLQHDHLSSSIACMIATVGTVAHIQQHAQIAASALLSQQ